MHDLVAAALERPQERREHGGGLPLGVVEQHNSATIGFEPAENQRQLLFGRHRIPVTGPEIGAEHHDPALLQPVEVSGVPEASLRGAAVLALERLGHEVADAPIAQVVEPRADRADAYRAAREKQQRLYDALYDAPA